MTDSPLTEQQLTDIEARANAEGLTPGPWTLDKEGCDCGGDYPCGHGLFVTSVITTTPTWSAAERCKRLGEQPRDYDFHRSDIGDFTDADWELMAHAREDVPALLAEVRRLQALNAQLDRALGETIDDRDRMYEIADNLAYAVAPVEVIGEHSSMNCPWTNAFELITPAAEVEKLRAELAEALRPNTPRFCKCGHSNLAHTVPAPHSCFAYGQTCGCQGYQQLPHDEAVAQLKRNQQGATARAAVETGE